VLVVAALGQAESEAGVLRKLQLVWRAPRARRSPEQAVTRPEGAARGLPAP